MSMLSEQSIKVQTNIQIMHHTYINTMYKVVMAMEWEKTLSASQDQGMHIIHHISVVVPTGLFAPNAWRDNQAAIR